MRPRRGANAIEFALTLPLWVAVFFGVVHGGLHFYAWSMASEAVRRGCIKGAEIAESLADPAVTAKGTMATWMSHGAMVCGQGVTCDAELVGRPPNRQLHCAIQGHSIGAEASPFGAWTFSVSHHRRLVRQ